MLIFACCVLPVIFVQYFDMWTIVAVLGLAGGAHQAWSASVYTLGSDMFPKSDVASITGLSGMAGQIGSVLFQTAVGFTLSHFVALGNPSHGYDIIFVVCGCAYLAAFIIFSLIVPKINMVESRKAELPDIFLGPSHGCGLLVGRSGFLGGVREENPARRRHFYPLLAGRDAGVHAM